MIWPDVTRNGNDAFTGNRTSTYNWPDGTSDFPPVNVAATGNGIADGETVNVVRGTRAGGGINFGPVVKDRWSMCISSRWVTVEDDIGRPGQQRVLIIHPLETQAQWYYGHRPDAHLLSGQAGFSTSNSHEVRMTPGTHHDA